MVIITKGEYLTEYQRVIYAGLESRWQINSQPWLQEQISRARHSAVDLFIILLFDYDLLTNNVTTEKIYRRMIGRSANYKFERTWKEEVVA